MFVTPARWYRKYYIYMYFLRKIIFDFPPKGKLSCFRGEKIPSFQTVRERSYFSAIFLKRPSRNIWRKYHISKYFFDEKDHLSFSVQGLRSHLREKEISSFPIIKERLCSSATFLERSSFQDVWKKKIWTSVWCKAPTKLFIIIMRPKMIMSSIASKFHFHTVQSRSQCPRAAW